MVDPLPGDTQSGATPLPATGTVRAVMRSTTDAQWWSFTPTTSGTFQVLLGELPRNYGLAVYYPGGSSSATGSTTRDRTLTITAKAGQRVTIKVSVDTGGFAPTAPYRLTVTSLG